MTVNDIVTQLQTRLGDDPNAPQGQQYYTYQECLNWVNACQRIFVLLTLCLETTENFTLRADGTSSYHLMNYYADWIAPLRVRLNGGLKLRASRISDLAGYNSRWRVAPGMPVRYAVTGFDLLSIDQQPTTPTVLNITYARCPAPLVFPDDVPEIPQEYHPLLIDGAIPICRAKEGAQELQKVMGMWNRYLDGAQKLGKYMLARNRERAYDSMPIELERFDRSRMITLEAAA